MTVSISPEKMAVYRATARKKAARKKAALDIRHNHAWQTAHIAARMLREDFDAQKVVVFGSLLNPIPSPNRVIESRCHALRKVQGINFTSAWHFLKCLAL